MARTTRDLWLEDRQGVESFAAELIDRFGPLPAETENLLKIVETKINCRTACIAKLDVGARGAVVAFIDSGFPDLAGLLSYVERLRARRSFGPTASWWSAATGPRAKRGSTARCNCRAASRAS